MERKNSISRKIVFCFIVIIIPLVLVAGLDIYTTLLLSIGFGASISLWLLSFNLKSSNRLFYYPKKN